MNFQQKLDLAVEKNNTLLCVGLDPDFEKLPAVVKNEKYPQFVFNKAIIDATHDLVCGYKPNSAFYEARGADGITELKLTCEYLREKYPELVIILDAKRGDIGTTNKGYAVFVFDYLQADAITLQPYFGGEALQPFLDRKEKGCIILCRTSNPGAKEFQDIMMQLVSSDSGNQNIKLYQYVANQVVQKWNKNNNCLMVVGATYPGELVEIRKIAPEMTFLVPGTGAQGGEIKKAIKAGLTQNKMGIILSTSRSILFASQGEDFARAARKEAMNFRSEINKFR